MKFTLWQPASPPPKNPVHDTQLNVIRKVEGHRFLFYYPNLYILEFNSNVLFHITDSY